jgi:NAD(P)H-dependent FMN reductase
MLPILADETPPQSQPKILAFAGSSRKDSVNKKLLLQATEMARTLGAKVTVIDLKDLKIPFYDGDLEKTSGLPEGAQKLRNLISSNDAIMIATPEYNGGMPGVLKNALDWASRSGNGDARDIFAGKKFAIMSASPGGYGGARALTNLRALIQAIGGNVIDQQVAVPHAFEAFTAKGELNIESLKEALSGEIQELVKSSQTKAATDLSSRAQ